MEKKEEEVKEEEEVVEEVSGAVSVSSAPVEHF